jgi:hypothetical protein
MALGNKVHFIILGIVVQLLFSTDIRAEEVKTRDDAARQEIVTGPEQHEVSLVSLYPWVVEGEALGTVAAYVYGDVTTERPADYWELYDKKATFWRSAGLTDSVFKGPLSIAALWERETGSRAFSLSSQMATPHDRLGSTRMQCVDVRLVAATSRNLLQRSERTRRGPNLHG